MMILISDCAIFALERPAANAHIVTIPRSLDFNALIVLIYRAWYIEEILAVIVSDKVSEQDFRIISIGVEHDSSSEGTRGQHAFYSSGNRIIPAPVLSGYHGTAVD